MTTFSSKIFLHKLFRELTTMVLKGFMGFQIMKTEAHWCTKFIDYKYVTGIIVLFI